MTCRAFIDLGHPGTWRDMIAHSPCLRVEEHNHHDNTKEAGDPHRPPRDVPELLIPPLVKHGEPIHHGLVKNP